MNDNYFLIEFVDLRSNLLNSEIRYDLGEAMEFARLNFGRVYRVSSTLVYDYKSKYDKFLELREQFSSLPDSRFVNN